MAGKMMDDIVRCSFCNKTQAQVRKLIAGPNGTYICDECIGICNEILEEEMYDGEEQEAMRDAQTREAEFYMDWPEYIGDDDDGVPMVRATKQYEVEVQDDESESAAVCTEDRQLSA